MTMISKNFTQEEFECPCCAQLVYEQGLIDKLQRLRDIMQRPFVVNSGYRCHVHNDAIGGSPRSQHMLGRACDISTNGWGAWTLYQFVGFATRISLSVGVYDGFVHVDNRVGDPIFFRGS